jgi:hypothetical protein
MLDLINVVKEGDIVFVAIPNPFYRKVAESTGSWISHVGFIYEKNDRRCVIAESTIPWSKLTPFEKFIGKSDKRQFAIRRLKSQPDADAIRRLRRAADSRMGKLYHLGFKLRSRRQFCSKFVYEVYKEALGIEIGEIEKFEKLLRKNPDVSLWFWRLWYFGFIPWKRETVTPMNQYESDLLESVYEADPENA